MTRSPFRSVIVLLVLLLLLGTGPSAASAQSSGAAADRPRPTIRLSLQAQAPVIVRQTPRGDERMWYLGISNPSGAAALRDVSLRYNLAGLLSATEITPGRIRT